MTLAIQDYARRPQRAHESDGLNDLMAGIGIPTIILTQLALSQGKVSLGSLLFFLPIYALLFLLRRGVVYLRERYVYPRIGYVAPRVVPIYQRILFVAVPITAAVGILAFTLPKLLVSPTAVSALPSTIDLWNVVILGIVWAAISGYQFSKFRFGRHLATAIVALIVPIVLLAVHCGEMSSLRWFVVAVCATMAIGGALAFRKVLQLPLIAEAAGE